MASNGKQGMTLFTLTLASAWPAEIGRLRGGALAFAAFILAEDSKIQRPAKSSAWWNQHDHVCPFEISAYIGVNV